MKKLTLEDCENIACLHGGKCLSTHYVNAHQKLLWQCQCGHQWENNINNIKSKNQWCPYCAGNIKKTVEDCYRIATQKGGKCLSAEYINNHTKMLWECSEGHQWYASYKNIKRNKWCLVCCGLQKKTIEDCIFLANKNKGRFLSKQYNGCDLKYLWQCKEGHQFCMSYTSVKLGRWCVECSKVSFLEKCCLIAEKNNGMCLSQNYVNNKTPLRWQCENGHTWFATYSNIQLGTWCNQCSFSKSQKKLKKVLNNIFSENLYYNFRNFIWLKSKASLELDFYIPSLKLAIEYDGEQHFCPIEYFGGLDRFVAQKQRDFLKNRLIHQNKQDVKTFIRIPYWEEISKENILKILERNGVI